MQPLLTLWIMQIASLQPYRHHLYHHQWTELTVIQVFLSITLTETRQSSSHLVRASTLYETLLRHSRARYTVRRIHQDIAELIVTTLRNSLPAHWIHYESLTHTDPIRDLIRRQQVLLEARTFRIQWLLPA